MASRSSTGVIVALVVFVVFSCALLAVSIILYTDKAAAEVRESEMRANLRRFITDEEQARDTTKALLDRSGSDSLFAHLTEQLAQTGEFVAGNRAASLGDMRSTLGLGEKDTVKDAMRKLAQDRDARRQEADSLKTRSNDLAKEIDALKGRLADAEKARGEAVERITATIAGYQQSAEGYRDEFDAAKSALDQARADLESRFASESAALQNEIDGLRAERQVLDERIGALTRKVEATSTKAGNPAALVDARVVDFDPRTGTAFIDIGANKRVVPGMTFEVFEDAPAIAAAAESGARGKASVQVIKVGDTSSTCRVIRTSGTQSIGRDDVVANAVFNPDYRFRFLVHGKFDANGDGRATTGESDYVRSRIVEWGGEVVEGDTLSGDLDFLVLGSQPPFPAPLPSDATEAQIFAFTEQRAARELYENLFRTATEAQIPILNWSRFEALTGSVNR